MEDVYRYTVTGRGPTDIVLADVGGVTLRGLCDVLAGVCARMEGPASWTIHATRIDINIGMEYMATVHDDGSVEYSPMGSVLSDRVLAAQARQMFANSRMD